eukprot:scaffold224066_cov34-Tisochrysis_lutea.AAC.3
MIVELASKLAGSSGLLYSRPHPRARMTDIPAQTICYTNTTMNQQATSSTINYRSRPLSTRWPIMRNKEDPTEDMSSTIEKPTHNHRPFLDLARHVKSLPTTRMGSPCGH